MIHFHSPSEPASDAPSQKKQPRYPNAAATARPRRRRPHYDANRAADAEDASRGGQTLATLLVYLNDVQGGGGRTRFGKLRVDVSPRKGDACLFFPADASGAFDERLEHEGEAPAAEKWIGRVWVHARPISGETGCPPATLEALRRGG